MNHTLSLLAQRRFAPFFWTQFLGALNDNLFKNALVILIAAGGVGTFGLDANLLVNLGQAVFILPFFLFSATAGQLADRYDKARLTRLVKGLEIAVMALGGIGLLSASLPLLLLALALLGLHSTLFGPVKYAILPQHLHADELVAGNGLVESGTFVAILLGTLGAGLLIGRPEHGVALTAAATLVVAAAGWLVARRVPATPAPAPELRINANPLTESLRCLRLARAEPAVFQSILGISWLWFYGATLLAQLPAYGLHVLGGDTTVVSLLLGAFAVGTALGALACERLSGGHIELGLVPIGSIGLTLFGVDLWWHTPDAAPASVLDAGAFLASPGAWRVLADLALIGVFGGLYSVPLYTLVQSRSRADERARVIAANNILNAAFMVAAALLAMGLFALGFTVPELFLYVALLNAAVAVYIYALVPEFLLRFVVYVWVHVMYRLRVQAGAHIPASGPALLVCNHVSFVDALVIAAACPRPVRFVMDHRIFRNLLLGGFFRAARAIPIAPRREDPAVCAAAFDAVAQALADGELVCLFPEGAITRDGAIAPFRPGIAEILRRSPVPVVPLALRGLWGSFFSHKAGTALRVPRGVLSRIELVAGAPLAPAVATPEGLHAHVSALRGVWA